MASNGLCDYCKISYRECGCLAAPIADELPPLDNSGKGPLKVLGFNKVPHNLELYRKERFAHGANDDDEYQHARRTARELAMLRLMDALTDRLDWHRQIFDEDTVLNWRDEALQRPLISPAAWDWCLSELRDKATEYNATGQILTLNAAACISKSDTLVIPALREELQQGAASLQALAEKDGHHEQVWNLVDPSLYPLVFGRTSVLTDGGHVGLRDCFQSYSLEGTVVKEPYSHLDAEIEKRRELIKIGAADPDAKLNFELPHYGSWFRWSERFQSLPCEVEFKGETGTDVRISSYINNLHPIHHQALYGTIEKLISISIDSWNRVLIQDGTTHGRAPMRIRTYGVQDEHPEPGVSFTYEDWKSGHDEKAIIDPISRTALCPPYSSLTSTDHHHDLQEAFRKQGLQVIVQLASVELTPEDPSYPGNDWHVEGILNEHIAATSIYYYDVENVTEPRISFRQRTWLYRRACKYSPDDMQKLAEMFEIGFRDGESTGNQLQFLGSVSIRPGRLLSFPNVLQSRDEPFELADQHRPGHVRFLALHLVDPHYRICSTRNVPPQRHDWWADSAEATLGLRGLPRELVAMVMEETDQWPMGMEEANRLRLDLIKERREIMRMLNRGVKIFRFHGWDPQRRGPRLLTSEDYEEYLRSSVIV